MTAKEYLGQAYRIDQRINSKMEQIASLNLLAQKATTVFSDMPGNTTRNIHRMEDVIIKERSEFLFIKTRQTEVEVIRQQCPYPLVGAAEQTAFLAA